MNPEVREVFLKRTKMVQSMRRTLDSHGFIEVETPMMQPIAGGAVAAPFVTHHNTLDMDLYLRIAPELYLKRLVVGGLDRVYEINRNFRNEGLGWRWNPEFTMLEAYQAYTDYQGIMNLTQEFITEQAAKAVTGARKRSGANKEIDWTGQLAAHDHARSHHQVLARRSRRQSRRWPNSRPHEESRSWCSDSMPPTRTSAYDPNAPTGKNIAALFEAAAEEHLMQPTIIYEFPTAVSPLSKQKPDEPEWTERFEIYAGRWKSPTASVNSTIPKISAAALKRN